jgi:KUP system potassium uptake protein
LANFAKVAQGGYVPLILAALVYGVMLIWHLGANAVSARLQDEVVPVDAFMANIVRRRMLDLSHPTPVRERYRAISARM